MMEVAVLGLDLSEVYQSRMFLPKGEKPGFLRLPANAFASIAQVKVLKQ